MVHQSGSPERDGYQRAKRLGGSSRSCFSATPRPIQSRGHRFPASGYRNNDSGNLNEVGTNGRCWSSTANDGTNGRNFNFNSSSWSLNNNNRTNGYPVRAVAAFTSQRTLPLLIMSHRWSSQTNR